ncbi:Pre-mRNA-splicing factor sap61 [Hypsizygus marmoreus]|uniref:Pre-mRNA-splicing factor sap61 n=1 Tax=Hypsizygus marmoreus TaxID=39966 RepID=A0A369JL36_HYPMA|nr:Pre-mRNA-splicing factor sap61 [Hypsizygus marmoreus]
MDSIIEIQRQTHEEQERFERGLYTLLSRNQPTHEARLQTEHKAAQMLDRIASRALTLNSLYQDEDARKQEIDLLSAPAQQTDLSEFYSRLVKIQEHHSKYPDSVPGGFDLEIAAFLDEPEQDGGDEEYEDPISLLFSGEEAYGKYVDLYANHTAYSNLKNIGKRPGYLQYLDLLLAAQDGPVHRDLPKETRFTKDYETYIQNLHSYLLSFTKRTQPLVDIVTQQQEAEVEFNKKWEAGEISDWEESKPKAQANGNGSTGIWCAACQKHYSKQTVYDAHLTSKKHVKAVAKQETSGTPPANPNGAPATPAPSTSISTANSRLRHSALLTDLTTALLVPLIPTINETKSNVERRFSLTAREREQELLDQAKPPPPPANTNTNGPEEEEEEEERIYNPLKLPLGWDGKPIPYWLYKLHGLGVEYRCEICSDHVYMGRKNFDRHFQESRHAFGMRALGLPNTKHFHEITRIEDALSLAEKLKQEGRNEIFEQETMEELEDDEGNVYNRKTYEDLKKQGLI